MLVIVVELDFDHGGFDQYLAFGAGHHDIQELLHLFMLAAGGTHRDQAGFRVDDYIGGAFVFRNLLVGTGLLACVALLLRAAARLIAVRRAAFIDGVLVPIRLSLVGVLGTGLHDEFVRFLQNIVDVLFEDLPEAVIGSVRNRGGRIVIARAAAGSGAGGRYLRRNADLAGRIARHVDIVDPVVAQEWRIRNHDQIGPVQLVAHVHLFTDARKQLRQSLVERIQGDFTLDARMDIDVDLGVARQCKQQ